MLRVSLAEGRAWFKACVPVQASEPRLTAELFARWPDRVAEVLVALAIRIGTFAHTIAWARQRDHRSEEARAEFDRWFPFVLRRAVAQTLE